MTWGTTFLSKKGQRTTFEYPNLEAGYLKTYLRGINSQAPSSHKNTACIYTNISNNQRLRRVGQNALAPGLCFPYVSRDRWSKHA